MDVAAYMVLLDAGLKWCTICKTLRPRVGFGRDCTRSDGLATKCLAHKRVVERKSTKGRRSTFKGCRHTPEARAKMRAAKVGWQNPRKGIPRTPEERAKISAVVRVRALRGPACPSFIDGKAVERRGIRLSLEYKRWRFDVYSRDGFRCRRCGDKRGGNIVAHHIRPFATHPDLRFVVANGETLCETCHRKHHKEHGY